jgi:hypothetical protein
MPLVTLDDLKNYMDITLDPRQSDAAQMILDGLHGELEFILRRPIEVGQYTESWVLPENIRYSSAADFSYGGNGNQYRMSADLPPPAHVLYLDRSPVASVESVVKYDVVTGASTQMVEGNDYVPVKFGLYVYNVYGGERIEIDYTAGLDGENIPYLKLMVLRAASRETQNLHDDVVGLKDLNTREVALADVGFTDMEAARLKRMKRQRI